MLLGYARVSTDQQDHALQLDALAKAGCDRVFTETASGTKIDRIELAGCWKCLVQETLWWSGASTGWAAASSI
jgi:hypothetical protein